MVYIKTIKLIGFKSFGNLSYFTFDKKFTCLIGPSASGKSNIFNAIEFALDSSNLVQTESKNVLYQGNKDKKAKNFIEISFVDDSEKNLSQKSYETVITKLFNENKGVSFKLNNKSINQIEILKNFSLPRVEGITTINVLTKVKIHKILDFFIGKREEFVIELVKNLKGIFGVNNYNKLPPFQSTSIYSYMSIIYNELTGKNIKTQISDINSLSEQERTILAISLIFSLAELFNFPFLLIDDIDNTLDVKVIQNLAQKIIDITNKGIQVIAITHRELLMSKANIIWGVTSKNGLTQLWQMALDNNK